MSVFRHPQCNPARRHDFLLVSPTQLRRVLQLKRMPYIRVYESYILMSHNDIENVSG